MSTDDTADFFDTIAYGGAERAEEGIARDRWGRPLIIQPGTGELVAYTRASTMANYISDSYGLHRWQMALVAQGVGHRRDLADVAASLPPYDDMTSAEKKQLREVVDEALVVAKAYAKANHGSAIHAFTDPTRTSGPVPEHLEDDVRSHAQALESTGIVVLATEIFVVNDKHRVAGTLDQIVGIPALDCLMVADTKTGRQNLHSTAIQVACYADSVVYDPQTGERTSIQEHVEQLVGIELPELSTSRGLYTHVPRGEGKTTMHPLNLDDGRRMLEICATVRDWNRTESFVAADVAEWLTSSRRLPAMKAIEEAADFAALEAAVQRYRWCWDDRLNKVAQQKWVEMGSPTE